MSERQAFLIKSCGKKTLIPVQDVLWLEAKDKYITIATATKEYLWEGSLTVLQEEFGGKFERIHRRHLVRADLIEEANLMPNGRWMLTLRGVSKQFHISRRERANLNKALKRLGAPT